MEFKVFGDPVKAQFDKMAKGNLFLVDVNKDEMWEFYLDSFPEGTNLMFQERREYDCQCCRHFIKNLGAAVAIVDGSLQTIWDVETEGYYKVVAKAMSEYIKSKQIKSIFVSEFAEYGSKPTPVETKNGIVVFNHFYAKVPAKFVVGTQVATKISDANGTVAVFKRGLIEITLDAVEVIDELITAKSLAKGSDYKDQVKGFLKLKVMYDAMAELPQLDKDLFIWQNYNTKGARLRNNVVGTLLQDLSEGADLQDAVGSYNYKTDPVNFSRSTKVMTEGMKKKAMEKIDELGIRDSLQRRHAVYGDVSINDDIIFKDVQASALMKDSLDDLLSTQVVKTNKGQNFDKVEEMNIEDFIKNIVPNAESLEIQVQNNQTKNLVSLIAPADAEAPNILKWSNNFSYSYNGNITDSAIKEAVKKAGGSVEGDLRVSLSWNNYDDLDIHIDTPKGKIYHGNKQAYGGVLDVDMNVSDNHSRTPVENVIFADRSKLPIGLYRVKINQFTSRENRDVASQIEVEFNDTIHTFTIDKHISGTKSICDIYYDGQTFSIKKIYAGVVTDSKGGPAKQEWGITTKEFIKVNLLMKSPNYWDDNAVATKHYFFMLEGCVNPGPTRGLYTEFLMHDLHENRKVFEVLGDLMKCEPTDDQLSGVGFSIDKRDEVIVKVTGKINRVIRVSF